MKDILNGLNEKQIEAVTATEGPVLVISGPGSGKTLTLTHRVAYLISKGVNPVRSKTPRASASPLAKTSGGVKPENILAITFTNKAAGEMKERVVKLLAHADKQRSIRGNLPTICTFHSLGARILRRHAEKLGFVRNFIIYDEDDSLKIIKVVITNLELNQEQFSPKKLQNLISSLKNDLIEARLYEEGAQDPRFAEGSGEASIFSKKLALIYLEYERELKKNNAFDFDDLIMKVNVLFKSRPDILKKYQSQFKYILVDEFQDSNIGEYQMVKALAQNHQNIFVVGDMDQAIYGWKGANFRNVLNFEKDFPKTKIIFLEESYRSSQNILEAANEIISGNLARYEKTLWTKNGKGDLLVIKEMRDEKEEAEFVTRKILELTAGRGNEATQNTEIPGLKDITVIFRTNAQSRILEEACLRAGIPYKIIGTVRFYERKEIKDIVAWLRLCVNEKDGISLQRILKLKTSALKNHKSQIPPKENQRFSTGQANHKNTKYLPARAFGSGRWQAGKTQTKKTKNTIVNELLKDFKEKAQRYNLTNLIKYIIKKTGYESYIRDGSEIEENRWENVLELLSVAKKFDSLKPPFGIQSFLEEAALLSEHDEVEDKKELANLMTIHAAKGLEFDTVFITGCEEGLFPHARSLLDGERLEEERRLCYVALTRAKRRAYFTFSQKRTIFGQTQINLPSRFLGDIPKYLVEYQSADEENIKTIELE